MISDESSRSLIGAKTYHGAPARGVARVRTRRREVAHAKASSALLRQTASIDNPSRASGFFLLAKSSSVLVLRIISDLLRVDVFPAVEVRQLDHWVVKTVPGVAIHATSLRIGDAEVPKIVRGEVLSAIQIADVPVGEVGRNSSAAVERASAVGAVCGLSEQDALVGNISVLRDGSAPNPNSLC